MKGRSGSLSVQYCPDICVGEHWGMAGMASSAQPGSEGVKELMRKLQQALDFLLDVAFPQACAAVSEAESNHAECVALVRAHQVGLAQISVLVDIVLRRLAAPFRFRELDGKLGGLVLLLLSVAKIKRCAQSGQCCMSRFSELPDLDVGNGSSSIMRFFLLRDFFFSVDLARVAFVTIMLESKIHQGKSWRRRRQSRSDIEEEFCDRPVHELFDWCKRKCRPVLKQSVLDLGREITQHIVLKRPTAFARTGPFNPWNTWTVDPASELEEPSAEPRDSLPLEIDFEDVHNQEFLGQGGYGAVFRCSWNGKLAAMKIIQLDVEEPELERRFEMEVSILASLQHPNAVPVFGFGYKEGRAKGFFVMEQMQTDLGKLIRKRGKRSGEWRVFPLDVAVDIMSQIVEGMCGLRRRRVIHRDLKPANILVNQPDESMGLPEVFFHVKLADFGYAKMRDGLDSVFRTLRAGTPAYMAPEVMSPTLLPERNGEHGYSWKADVYSFAMVCSEILSGERPFQNLDTMDNILAAVRGGKRPELGLDDGDPLKGLIEDCWKFNAEERPDFGEVRRRLWECRVYHFFTAKEVPCRTRLDARGFSISRDSTSREEASSSGDEMEGEQAAVEGGYARSLQRMVAAGLERWRLTFLWIITR